MALSVQSGAYKSSQGHHRQQVHQGRFRAEEAEEVPTVEEEAKEENEEEKTEE